MARTSKKHLMKWTERVEEKLNGKIKEYSSSESFYKGDLINHNHFGKGRVETSFGNKIEVIFQDKMRILIHRLIY